MPPEFVESPLRRKLWLAASTLVLLSPVLGGAWCALTYDSELKAIERELNVIPGVTVERIWGNEDVTLEDIGAKVNIAGKGSMMFFDLQRSSFEHASSLDLAQIGPWFIHRCGEAYLQVSSMGDAPPTKSTFHGGSINLVPGSPYAKLFPVEIRNIQDAILHFDELLAVVSQWPRTPDRQLLVNNQGLREWFSVSTDHQLFRCEQDAWGQ